MALYSSNFAVYPAQNRVTTLNGEQPIRLANGLLYPKVEVEQRTHSGDENGYTAVSQSAFTANSWVIIPNQN